MHAQAAQALSERAKLSPNNPMIWNDLGVEYIAAGQSAEAQEAFMRAHKAFPEYPLPLYNLGRLAMGRCIEEQTGQHPSLDLTHKFAIEAIRYLTESLSKDPLLCPAHALLAAAYTVVGDETRSRLHLQEASQLSPENGAAPRPAPAQSFLLRNPGEPPARSASPFLLSSGETLNVRTF